VAAEIPGDVAQFIQHTLPSPAHLEALAVMCGERARWWTGETLGRELRILTAAAEEVLEDLCSANLLEVQIASALAYRYTPGSAALKARAAAVVEALRYAPVQVYTLCGSPSVRAARQFADAFRLRRRSRG
jgi:hypothetical protein